MAKSFNKLQDKLSPESRDRIREKVDKLLKEVSLGEPGAANNLTNGG